MPFIAKISFFLAATPAEGKDCSLGSHSFFFFPHWWEYLKTQTDSIGNCAPVFHFPGDIWMVGLAILDMLLRLAGFVAVVSLIIAGLQLIMSEGNPEKAVSARSRLINSIAGLCIALVSTGLVAFLGNRIGGGTTTSGLPTTKADIGPGSSLANIFNIAFVIFGAITFLYMVIAGFRLVTSRGEPQKVADIRRQFEYAALGLFLIGAAAALVNIVIKGAG